MVNFQDRIAYDGFKREFRVGERFGYYIKAEKNPDGSVKIGTSYKSIDDPVQGAIDIPIEYFGAIINAFNAICERGKDVFKDEEYYKIIPFDDGSVTMWIDRVYGEKHNCFEIYAPFDRGFSFTCKDALALRDILKELKAAKIPEIPERPKTPGKLEIIYRKLFPQSS